ncbi:MAG: hypothetical protein IKG22_08595 [Atopobiaceae bacterium]|nr:hypothetical protein [Atopobiaceae bacterium]
MKYENISDEILANATDGMELDDEALEGVAGGGPRFRVPRNPLKTITDTVHTVKKVVEAIASKVSGYKRELERPWRKPDGFPFPEGLPNVTGDAA